MMVKSSIRYELNVDTHGWMLPDCGAFKASTPLESVRGAQSRFGVMSRL